MSEVKGLVTSPEQLKPGVRVTGYFPNGYERMEVLNHPYMPEGKLCSSNTSCCLGSSWRVDVYVYCDHEEGEAEIKHKEELHLSDYGIMSDGRLPYNQNFLVLGWNDELVME